MGFKRRVEFSAFSVHSRVINSDALFRKRVWENAMEEFVRDGFEATHLIHVFTTRTTEFPKFLHSHRYEFASHREFCKREHCSLLSSEILPPRTSEHEQLTGLARPFHIRREYASCRALDRIHANSRCPNPARREPPGLLNLTTAQSLRRRFCGSFSAQGKIKVKTHPLLNKSACV